jgi:hypothetical protein
MYGYGKKEMDEELEKAIGLIKLGRFIPGRTIWY